MREVCEACDLAQPPDWKPGDLCCFCGQAVRREVRCFWCVTWVPAAAFCRSCGAVVVEERLFGAARMLKDAGSDRFTIPKQLQEFPPDQIENFMRMYQRQAVVVARHVDDVRVLEGLLGSRAWSAPLEDALIAQLPWDKAAFTRLSSGGAQAETTAEGLPLVLAIQRQTPFTQTGQLASVARVRLQDWQALEEVTALLHTDDVALRRAAALALSSWRAVTQAGFDRSVGRLILAELAAAPTSLAVQVGRSLLGPADADAVRVALAGSAADADLAFGAALVLEDLDRLVRGLQGDDLMRIAAGRALIGLGRGGVLGEALAGSAPAVQLELLQNLVRRKEPYPDLGVTLLGLLETHADATIRERSARLLCRSLRPEWAERVARAAQSERAIYQSLLLPETALPPETVSAVLDVMLERGAFRTFQYGLPEAGRRGAVRDDYVIRRFATADQESRLALLRFAEEQLGARQDETLHRFVMGVVFGPYPAEVRGAAWWTLSRWYKRLGDHRGEGPFRLTAAGVERFFGSMAAFLPQLGAVLADRPTMTQVGLFEFLATFLNSSDAAAIQAMAGVPGATDALVGVLRDAIGQDYWPNTVEGMIILLSRIGTQARWQAPVLAGLTLLNKHGNYAFDKALRRVQLAEHGIPEEDQWGALPPTFAPDRFPHARVAGQQELLNMVEHQLIHRTGADPVPVLERFLLGVVCHDGDAAIRIRAMRLYRERATARRPPLQLTPAGLTAALGSPAEGLVGLAGVLSTRELMADAVTRDVLSDWFGPGATTPATVLTTTGEAGTTCVRALLGVLGGREPELDRLRRSIIRLLVPLSSGMVWWGSLVAALHLLAMHPDGGVRAEAATALSHVQRQQPGPAAGTA